MKKHFNKKNIIIGSGTILYIIIISILNYLEILNYSITSILNMLLGVFIFFYISFKISRKKQKKGYLWGLKIGLILLTIFFLLSLILQNNFSLKTIIYYLILLLTSVSAGMLGINKS